MPYIQTVLPSGQKENPLRKYVTCNTRGILDVNSIDTSASNLIDTNTSGFYDETNRSERRFPLIVLTWMYLRFTCERRGEVDSAFLWLFEPSSSVSIVVDRPLGQ